MTTTPEHISELIAAHTRAHQDLLSFSQRLQSLMDQTELVLQRTSTLEIIWSGSVGPTGNIQTSKPMTDYDFIIVGYDLSGSNTWNHTVVILKETITSKGAQVFIDIDTNFNAALTTYPRGSEIVFGDDPSVFTFKIGDRWTSDNRIKSVTGVRI